MKKNQRITYPSSDKIYVKGKIHNIDVGMRCVSQLDTIKVVDGVKQVEQNVPVTIYDTRALIRTLI